jgi:hypothetical protein
VSKRTPQKEARRKQRVKAKQRSEQQQQVNEFNAEIKTTFNALRENILDEIVKSVTPVELLDAVKMAHEETGWMGEDGMLLIEPVQDRELAWTDDVTILDHKKMFICTMRTAAVVLLSNRRRNSHFTEQTMIWEACNKISLSKVIQAADDKMKDMAGRMPKGF